jgi:phosphoglycerol transferase
VIVAVVALSLVPNALYHVSEGANIVVAHRKPVEAEMYGLRITQMLFPAMGHRVPELADFTASYMKPLARSEGFTAALGVVGSIGFLISLAAFFSGDTRRYPALWAGGALCAVAVLYATIGGFGAIASQWIPEIRGLNRISVFIGFFSIVAFMVATNGLLRSWRTPLTRLLMATFIVVLACLDQIPAVGTDRTDVVGFTARSEFFERVTHAIPQGNAVYELPYVYFPESPHPAGSYFQIEPYLYTNGLRWSFGDMQGRPSDLWNEQASTLRGEEFADAIARAGFGAIYVDRRGYTDNGVAIEKELRAQFGAPIVEDAALRRAVYRVHAPNPASAPLIITDLGRGWLPWEHDAAGEIAQSRGDADMIVANPNGVTVPFTTRFKLTSAVPRKVTLAYGTQVLSALQLKANEQRDVTVSFDAQPGVSRWSLTTDQPAQPTRGSGRESSAFTISALSYTSGGVLPHQ